ncbi:MAG: TauD/TfdA family dioxygenase [Alphaproteobacteria bacterium]|nr:TauD/TfdA family dioxygenase [Alphaproteobacteria bacterium]
MAFQTVALDAPLGAEIRGLDVRQMTRGDAQALNRALLDHHVLLLRDQRPSDQQLVDFGTSFGEIKTSRFVSPLSGHNQIMVISNIREDGKPLGQLPDGEMWFHIDQIYTPQPCRGAALFALEIPGKGGDTCWSNNVRAYDDLPSAMKKRLEGLTALHSFQYGATTADARKDENRPRHSHPLVRRIPETGKRALTVCRLMTDRINEVPEEESRELIAELCDHLEQPKYVYKHKWRTGDILVWDNRCTSHARTDFSETERRLMKRVTIADNAVPLA